MSSKISSVVASGGFALNNAIALQSIGMAAVETSVLVKTATLDMTLDTVEQAGDAMSEMMADPPLTKPETSQYINFRV